MSKSRIMEATFSKWHECRRTDIVKMFFSIANSIRLKGRDMFWQPTADGIIYTFAIGNNRITYTVQKGGALC